jgi:electron transfer flavoprotein-quinone oxidoreductase
VNSDWDVAVVGGGFAGSIAACLLARKGFRVVMLERGKQRGRETRSGNLASIPWWLTIGHPRPGFLVPVDRWETTWLGRDAILRKVDRGKREELYAFRREDLDAYLADAVARSGVHVIADFGVEEVVGDTRGLASVRSADRTVAARVIIVASGSDEPILARSNLVKPKPRRSLLCVCQQRLALADGQAPRGDAAVLELACLAGFPRAVGYVLFLEREAFVVIAIAVRPEALGGWEFRPDSLLRSLKGHPFLGDLFAQARVVDWRTRFVGGVPPFPRRLYRDRVLLVGDAALPLGGSLRPGAGFRWAHATAREAAAVLSPPLESPTRLFLRPYAERLAGAGGTAWRSMLGARIGGFFMNRIVRLLFVRDPEKSLRL